MPYPTWATSRPLLVVALVVGVVAVVAGPVGDAEGVVAGVVERWSGWCQWWWLVVGVVGDTEAGAEAAPRVRAAPEAVGDLGPDPGSEPKWEPRGSGPFGGHRNAPKAHF